MRYILEKRHRGGGGNVSVRPLFPSIYLLPLTTSPGGGKSGGKGKDQAKTKQTKLTATSHQHSIDVLKARILADLDPSHANHVPGSNAQIPRGIPAQRSCARFQKRSEHAAVTVVFRVRERERGVGFEDGNAEGVRRGWSWGDGCGRPGRGGWGAHLRRLLGLEGLAEWGGCVVGLLLAWRGSEVSENVGSPGGGVGSACFAATCGL